MVKRVRVTDPLIVMFRNEDHTVSTHIYPGVLSHRHYGLLVCDLVRHIARAFDVDEDEVWAWVDQERDHPTTDIRRLS